MDRDDKDNADGPLTDGEREPPKSSFIKARGRTKSPRVVVLDCDQNTVEVKNRSDLGPIGRSIHAAVNHPNSSLEEYQ